MWRRLAPVALLLFCASTAFGFNSNMPGGSISGGTCTGGQFMTGITAGGAPVCGTPSGGAPYPPGSPPQIGGFSALNTSEAQTVVGDFTFARTGTAQLTATVTKLNGITPGGVCSAGTFTSTISSSGVPTCTAPPAPAAGSISDAMLTGAYSGTGVCSAGTFASTLNRNAAPTCTAPSLSGQTYNNATFTGTVTMPAGVITDANLANAYSGIGACTGGQFVSTLNRNAAPTCTSPPSGFTAGGDLSGTSTTQSVIGIRSTSVPALASGYLHYTGAAFVWDTPGGGFTAGGDLSGSATTQTVIGIRSTSVPILATGYLFYTGSAFVWQTPAAGGTVTSITAGTGLTGGTISTSGTIALATPVSITNGGTGSTTAPSVGQIGVASSTTAFTPVTMSGDATITSAGVITVSKVGGVAFGPLATATTPLSVANGGTGTSSAPSAGQLLIAQSGTAYAPLAVSGDATLSNAGALTVTKSGGTALTSLFAPLTNPTNGQNNYAPLSSPSLSNPTFTGTLNFPDGSTYTTAGHNSMKALGVNVAAPATAGQIATSTELLTQSAPGTGVFLGPNTTTPYGSLTWASGSTVLASGSHQNTSGLWVADATASSQINIASNANGYAFDLNTGLTVGSTFTPTAIMQINNTTLGIASGMIYAVGGTQIGHANLGDTIETATPWTPVLSFGGATTGITYTVQSGFYMKHGKWIYVNYNVQLSSVGTATGGATLCGLPFAANSGGLQGVWPIALIGGLTGGATAFVVLDLPAGGATCFNVLYENVASPNLGAAALLTNANFTNATNIQGSLMYVTN